MHGTYLSVFLLLLLALASCKQKKENAPQKTAFVATVHWTDSLVQLGKIRMGDTIAFRFIFRNTGTTPLVVTEAGSSCSCTEVSYPITPIAPGDTAAIISRLYTQKAITGMLHKNIHVAFAGITRKSMLVYEGEITGHKTLRTE